MSHTSRSLARRYMALYNVYCYFPFRWNMSVRSALRAAFGVPRSVLYSTDRGTPNAARSAERSNGTENNSNYVCRSVSRKRKWEAVFSVVPLTYVAEVPYIEGSNAPEKKRNFFNFFRAL